MCVCVRERERERERERVRAAVCVLVGGHHFVVVAKRCLELLRLLALLSFPIFFPSQVLMDRLSFKPTSNSFGFIISVGCCSRLNVGNLRLVFVQSWLRKIKPVVVFDAAAIYGYLPLLPLYMCTHWYVTLVVLLLLLASHIEKCKEQMSQTYSAVWPKTRIDQKLHCWFILPISCRTRNIR